MYLVVDSWIVLKKKLLQLECRFETVSCRKYESLEKMDGI